ncbi:LPS assembly lipoprotein LptE [Cryomorphaceae bacterium 1068]|nr:LPS assembly lipoprotein LptE [Cryomorphaceae bacterium 1068]
MTQKLRISLVLFVVAISGCTVNYSFTGADIPADADTFSIQQFQIATPQAAPEYGLVLSESLKDLMLAQTRLDLAEKRGDLQFEGVVTGYQIGNAAISSEEFTSLNRLTITVKVKYTNTIEKDKSFEKNFSRFVDYDSQQNFSDIETELVEDVNSQLIQDIFDASLGAW